MEADSHLNFGDKSKLTTSPAWESPLGPSTRTKAGVPPPRGADLSGVGPDQAPVALWTHSPGDSSM